MAALILNSCLKEPENYPPMIESIMLEPSEDLTPGSEILVYAVVTDRDGDPLEFSWSSNGGTFTTPNQPYTTWNLSTDAEPLSYESITLTVTDGIGSVTSSRTILVSEGLFISGYTYFDGTTIPVAGVSVTIGKFSTVSNDQGFYSIANLKEGNTLVTGSKEGFELFESVVYVDNPKSNYNLLMSSRTESRHISGNVKTVDDVTYEGLKVTLLNPDGSESNLFGFTDPSGNYDIDHVPLGTRYLMVSNDTPGTHFLNDSMIYRIELDGSGDSFNARIKIKRTILSDHFLSEQDKWDFEGATSEGFYLLGKGQRMTLKEFIQVPRDAEKAMFYMNSYVVGGCDLVGNLPSHRVWIVNSDDEYMGGLSWGGEGSNFPAELEWYPSESPNFMDIYGRDVKVRLEIFRENTCVPNPLWRIYHLEFSYYY
jgi:hypothetical protein